MTRKDIVMILELKACGVKTGFIAHHVYGITASTLRGHLKRWDAS
jgi:hypothetical protein